MDPISMTPVVENLFSAAFNSYAKAQGKEDRIPEFSPEQRQDSSVQNAPQRVKSVKVRVGPKL